MTGTPAPSLSTLQTVGKAIADVVKGAGSGAMWLLAAPVKIAKGLFSAGGTIGATLLKPINWVVKNSAELVSSVAQTRVGKVLLGAALIATAAVAAFSVIVGNKRIKNAPHAAAGETLEAAYLHGRGPSQEPNYAEMGEAQGINYSKENAARVLAGRSQQQLQQPIR